MPPLRRARRILFRGSITAVVVAFLLAAVSAQQTGENINVLPVAGADPIRGDAYLQRQVEPSLAVSTRNPQHILAFYNDYRAVDIPTDVGIGESVARRLFDGLRNALARVTGREPARRPGVPARAAAA